MCIPEGEQTGDQKNEEEAEEEEETEQCGVAGIVAALLTHHLQQDQGNGHSLHQNCGRRRVGVEKTRLQSKEALPMILIESVFLGVCIPVAKASANIPRPPFSIRSQVLSPTSAVRWNRASSDYGEKHAMRRERE